MMIGLFDGATRADSPADSDAELGSPLNLKFHGDYMSSTLSHAERKHIYDGRGNDFAMPQLRRLLVCARRLLVHVPCNLARQATQHPRWSLIKRGCRVQKAACSRDRVPQR